MKAIFFPFAFFIAVILNIIGNSNGDVFLRARYRKGITDFIGHHSWIAYFYFTFCMLFGVWLLWLQLPIFGDQNPSIDMTEFSKTLRCIDRNKIEHQCNINTLLTCILLYETNSVNESHLSDLHLLLKNERQSTYCKQGTTRDECSESVFNEAVSMGSTGLMKYIAHCKNQDSRMSARASAILDERKYSEYHSAVTCIRQAVCSKRNLQECMTLYVTDFGDDSNSMQLREAFQSELLSARCKPQVNNDSTPVSNPSLTDTEGSRDTNTTNNDGESATETFNGLSVMSAQQFSEQLYAQLSRRVKDIKIYDEDLNEISDLVRQCPPEMPPAANPNAIYNATNNYPDSIRNFCEVNLWKEGSRGPIPNGIRDHKNINLYIDAHAYAQSLNDNANKATYQIRVFIEGLDSRRKRICQDGGPINPMMTACSKFLIGAAIRP